MSGEPFITSDDLVVVEVPPSSVMGGERAVHLRHKPTGTEALGRGRSVLAAKQDAMRVLREKLRA